MTRGPGGPPRRQPAHRGIPSASRSTSTSSPRLTSVLASRGRTKNAGAKHAMHARIEPAVLARSMLSPASGDRQPGARRGEWAVAGSSGSRAFVVVALRSEPRRRPTRAVRDGPRGTCEPVQWLAADDGACALDRAIEPEHGSRVPCRILPVRESPSIMPIDDPNQSHRDLLFQRILRRRTPRLLRGAGLQRRRPRARTRVSR